MQGYRNYHQNWKSHLINLPTVNELPDWQGKNDFACLIIPIFSFTDSTEFIESYVAKASAWVLKTWKKNSDMKEYDIPCYIYVERNIAAAALPILHANKVPESNIKVVDYDQTEWLAKCLQPVFDKDLEQYEYVIISDVDMFCLKSDSGRKLQIIQKMLHHKPEGFGCKVFNHKLPIYWMPNMKYLYEHRYGRPFEGDLFEKWMTVVEALVGKPVRQSINRNNMWTWTGAMAFKQGTFTDKEWLETACKTLGDDEGVAYAWSKLSETNEIWDFGRSLGIEVFVDITSYLHRNFSLKNQRLNDLYYKDVQLKTLPNEIPCLLHHHASVDYRLYSDIEAFL